MSWKQKNSKITSRTRRTRGPWSVYLYISIALVGLLFEYSNSTIPSKIRATATDAAMPILNVLAEPIRTTQDGIVRLAGVGDIYQKAQELEIENQELREWRDVARQLISENTRLREMLKAPGREVPVLASGTVIGHGGGAFVRSVIINVGENDRIIRDLPVTTEVGVIGRTISVGNWSTRVLLITDLNSKIPVRNARTGALAIASGRNDDLLSLDFLPVDADVKIGDQLLTSGHGGIFPTDLPLGEVVEISEVGIAIKPSAMLDRLDWVRILNYRPIDPEAEQYQPVPPVESEASS